MTITAARIHPLLERLTHVYTAPPTLSDFEAFAGCSKDALLFFVSDPERTKETLDLAVILPEIARAFPDRFEVGVLMPEVANAVASRYGVRRWPALVLLRDGKYVGAIEGLRDWDDYYHEIAHLLATEPSTPRIVIPLQAAYGATEGSCA